MVSSRARSGAPPSSADRPSIGREALPIAVVLAAGLFAYWGTWRGQFVFDDGDAIVKNQALLAGDWWNAAFGRPHQPLANRPLSCLSLVVDFAVFGPGPLGPHVTNLLLHLGNALLLLATARRCLLAPNLAGRFAEGHATWLAAAIAALWVAHPLGGDAVCYATQRSTLLFSGGLLLSFYGSLRAHAAPRPGRWRAMAVAAMAASMASKEDAVVGPLLFVLFERAFLLPTWGALRQRTGGYAAMALSWCVLAACIALGPSNRTVGYATQIPVTAWEWLMTQAGVVAHYLRLAVWPNPLRGAYDWDIVRGLADAILPGLLVLTVLGVATACWRRRPWWGWLGALFFLLLAPTSTVMPIITEVVAERRAYLPMLLVLVPLVVALDRGLAKLADAAVRRGVAALLVAGAVVVLGVQTRARVAVHADEAAFWTDAYAKRDPAARTFLAGLIVINYGDALWRQGRAEEAYACYDVAMQCRSPTANAIGRHAMSLLDRKRPAEAVDSLRRLAATDPDANVWGMLGLALSVLHGTERGRPDDPRLVEAEDALRRSLAQNPLNAQFGNTLADVLRARGRLAAAEAEQRQATERSTNDLLPYLLRAPMLERLGRRGEIGPMFQRLWQARPEDVALRVQVADWAVQRGDSALATTVAQDALRLQPGNRAAAALLQQAGAAPRR